jgi:hypothetical protein
MHLNTTSSHLGDEPFTLGDSAPAIVPLATAAGLGLLAITAALGWLEHDSFRHFFFSYLVAFCFFLSISLGALFFVAVQHLSRAGWSVTVRRLAEILAGALPALTVLFLPIIVPMLLGSSSLYAWVSPAPHDDLLRHKLPYLNLPFFGVRAVAYFAVWGLFGRYFLLRSVEQDRSGNPQLTLKMERASAVALILFAFTLTFAAFDWLMSLEPRWFSTIFGVYFFAGTVVAGLSAIILMAALLQASGRLRWAITTEHYHDLGKLLLSFVIFWGYIAFSQYMLIWYANLPEEVVWYRVRNAGPWGITSLLLLFMNLLIPFLGLMSREVKRRKYLLAFWAVWLLAGHWLDMYWLVMPTYHPACPPLGLLDLGCLLGLSCLYLAAVLRVAVGRALVPLKDPRLGESLAFENL